MFQRLVDFQHLCHALCHVIIEFIFGEPRKERRALPGTRFLMHCGTPAQGLQLTLTSTCSEPSKQLGSKPGLQAPAA